MKERRQKSSLGLGNIDDVMSWRSESLHVAVGLLNYRTSVGNKMKKESHQLDAAVKKWKTKSFE
jgi:hypothetical protein